MDPNQALHFVGPDLGPNCLQRLTSDNIRVNKWLHLNFQDFTKSL